MISTITEKQPEISILHSKQKCPEPQRTKHPVCTFVGALVSLGNKTQ